MTDEMPNTVSRPQNGRQAIIYLTWNFPMLQTRWALPPWGHYGHPECPACF
jgi:hypothetical protein